MKRRRLFTTKNEDAYFANWMRAELELERVRRDYTLYRAAVHGMVEGFTNGVLQAQHAQAEADEALDRQAGAPLIASRGRGGHTEGTHA